MRHIYPLIAAATINMGISGHLAAQDLQLELVPWAIGLPAPVDVTHAGDARLFIATQAGRVYVITDSMMVQPTTFLDISGEVNYDGEKGLLGIAFDPDYSSNGFFYVSYVADTGNGISTISRFHVSADPNMADPASEEVLYTYPQPLEIHKGGGLGFGPDGYLYISLGDGGGAGDPLNNAQDLSDPLGDILRIDPDPLGTYTVPSDNPWVGTTDSLPEIWASGFRNPFRIGFDRLTGDLWITDVGQESHEEVDMISAGDNSGPNFGWRCYEGNAEFNTVGCLPPANYRFPVTTHDHAILGGTFCAVIGGRVYRGTQFPHMEGRYIYGDHCSGELWALRPDGVGGWVDELAYSGAFSGVSSIGEGLDGTLFATYNSSGKVFKIVDHCPMDRPTITLNGNDLESSPAASYQWYLGTDPIPGADGQTYTPVLNGSYTVMATFANGCELTSDPFEFISTGIGGDALFLLDLYPQPATGMVTLRRSEAAPDTWNVTLLDARGAKMMQMTWPAGDERLQVDLSPLENGYYVAAIEDERSTPVRHAALVKCEGGR